MCIRDSVKKGLPILEDCIGGFAVLISENDGVNPVLRTDIVGRPVSYTHLDVYKRQELQQFLQQLLSWLEEAMKYS